MPIFLLAIPIVLFTVFFSYVVWDVRRARRQTADALHRLKTEPGSVTEVRLHDNDPITVEVRFDRKQFVELSGIHGVRAVRAFDDLKTQLPGARFAVYQNCRETQQPT